MVIGLVAVREVPEEEPSVEVEVDAEPSQAVPPEPVLDDDGFGEDLQHPIADRDIGHAGQRCDPVEVPSRRLPLPCARHRPERRGLQPCQVGRLMQPAQPRLQRGRAQPAEREEQADPGLEAQVQDRPPDKTGAARLLPQQAEEDVQIRSHQQGDHLSLAILEATAPPVPARQAPGSLSPRGQGIAAHG